MSSSFRWLIIFNALGIVVLGAHPLRKSHGGVWNYVVQQSEKVLGPNWLRQRLEALGNFKVEIGGRGRAGAGPIVAKQAVAKQNEELGESIAQSAAPLLKAFKVPGPFKMPRQGANPSGKSLSSAKGPVEAIKEATDEATDEGIDERDRAALNKLLGGLGE